MKTGERIINLERLFNIREGLSIKDDTLPRRFLEEPLPEGPSKGHICELQPMMRDYYRLRKWDSNTGRPHVSKLKELGIASESTNSKNGLPVT
jgi:aldehyde:ferredoxin oxidoreductase